MPWFLLSHFNNCVVTNKYKPRIKLHLHLILGSSPSSLRVSKASGNDRIIFPPFFFLFFIVLFKFLALLFHHMTPTLLHNQEHPPQYRQILAYIIYKHVGKGCRWHRCFTSGFKSVKIFSSALFVQGLNVNKYFGLRKNAFG